MSATLDRSASARAFPQAPKACLAYAVRWGLLALVAILSGQIRTAHADAICERCDLSWVECVRGIRTVSETCAHGIVAACRTGCESKATDNQGGRDPTRSATCVRNCSRNDSCEFDRMHDRQRCDGLRAVCRRDAACAS